MGELAELKVLDRRPTVDDLSFGGSGIAGIYAPVPREQALATVRRAVEVGWKHFDTAPLYGAGLSEEYYGEVLADAPVSVSTKVGRLVRSKKDLVPGNPHVMWDNDAFFHETGELRGRLPVYDYSGEGARISFRESQARLKKRVSILRLHDAETEEFFDWATQEGGAVDAMVKLRESGEVDQLSLGMNSPDWILRFLRKYPEGTFDNVMLAGDWHLLDFSGLEVLQECQARGISVTQAGLLGSGIFWGGPNLRYQTAPPEKLELVSKWKELASKYSVPLPAVAVTFAFLPACVDRLCIGAQSPEQVDANTALCDHKVPVQLWHEAKQQGLLPAAVPLPPLP
mmetsp:Transcript_26097/g.60217  ORF Transcript_26097/g.60217 Transcript_26097/m.60217 type:complete len:341 (-) Transcript_26097:243-1265(-)